jgi:hypothetical protein
LDIRRGLRSHIPGERGGPHRDHGRDERRNRIPQRDGKRPPRSVRRHPKKLRKPLPIKRRRHRCRDSTKRIAGDENRRPSEKNLTRRANHRHIFIIARSSKARAGKPAAGFFNWHFLNRTAAALRDATSSPCTAQRRKRVVARTSIGISRHARTCRRAAWLRPCPRRPRRDDPPCGSRLEG